MKKILLMLIFISVFQIQDTKVFNDSDELTIFNEIAKDMDLTLEEWQDVYIEDTTMQTFEKMKTLLLEDYTLQIEKTKQSIKYSFIPIKTEEPNQFNHEIHAVTPTQGLQKTKVHTILKGNKWNESVQDDYENLTSRLREDYKMKLDMSFACAKLSEDDIMENRYLLNRIMSKIQAIHIDEQHDNIANSTYERNVYGNSALFNHAMGIEDKQINFQVAIRKTTNKKKQVILGTPLILNEY